MGPMCFADQIMMNWTDSCRCRSSVPMKHYTMSPTKHAGPMITFKDFLHQNYLLADQFYSWRNRGPPQYKDTILPAEYRNSHHEGKTLLPLLIFIMRIPISGKTVFILRLGPDCYLHNGIAYADKTLTEYWYHLTHTKPHHNQERRIHWVGFVVMNHK